MTKAVLHIRSTSDIHRNNAAVRSTPVISCEKGKPDAEEMDKTSHGSVLSFPVIGSPLSVSKEDTDTCPSLEAEDVANTSPGEWNKEGPKTVTK